MDSAFDSVSPFVAEAIRSRFLAGDTMAEIRRGTDISAKTMRAMRDEVFGPLLSNPQAVKDLANGPCLNPLEVVRFRHGSKPRSTTPRPTQSEMFAA